ncbi:GFA family protein [Sphingopyxis sp. MWB1]|uniref:GFA family protein n=1 Tax=Sphingopyxis sp. MWB1 TaxID=1537715 RepID=UPI00051A2255|nr:hypothetical protein [Sphingopyxis sp. MWB1]
MSRHVHQHPRRAACSCGQVAFELSREPIMTVSCQCQSCQTAGAHFAATGTSTLDDYAGTPVVMFRKDRVRCIAGSERLADYRLSPDAPTRRVVAACCNTPMFLEFEKGHWLSIYRDRLPVGDRPPVELRTMTADQPPHIELPDDVPNLSHHSARFMWRLLAAWVAMGFRTPPMARILRDAA